MLVVEVFIFFVNFYFTCCNILLSATTKEEISRETTSDVTSHSAEDARVEVVFRAGQIELFTARVLC